MLQRNILQDGEENSSILQKVKTVSMKQWPVYVIVWALQDRLTETLLQMAEDA